MKYYRIRLQNKVSTSIFDEGLVDLRMAQLKNIFGDSAVIEKVLCDDKQNGDKTCDVAEQIVKHYIEREVKHIL